MTLAEKLKEKFQMEVHVPRYRERLILKPREMSFEKPEEQAPVPDVKNMMLNSLIDIEKELKRLRKKIGGEAPDGLGTEDVDRLAYLREELQNML